VSGNGRNAVQKAIGGGTVTKDSNVINGVTFAGGGYYELPSIVGDLTTANRGYTIAAWVKFTGDAGHTYSAIFGGDDPSGGTEWFTGKNSGNTCIGVQNAGYQSCVSNTHPLFDGNYHSFVFSLNRDGDGYVYVDGNQVGSHTWGFSHVAVNQETMLIGMEVEGEGYGWQGNIDQAIFFDDYTVEGAGIQLIHNKMKDGVYYCRNSAPI